MSKFNFGNVVVVDGDQIGVVVKSWGNGAHEVYVRSANCIYDYHENDMQHYLYSKDLHESETHLYDKR